MIAGLRDALLVAVPHIYIDPLKDETFGFANVSPLAILAHLVTEYATVTPDDLQLNLEQLKEPMDIALSVEHVFARVRKCRAYALPHDPISEAMAVRSTVQVLEATGLFAATLREWRMKPLAQQTWAQLKTDFGHADKERRRLPTVANAGYANAALSTNLRADNVTPPGTNRRGARIGPPQPRFVFEDARTWGLSPEQLALITPWCWTHGCNPRDPTHCSLNCQYPAPGHVRTATIDNMQGGNNQIRRQRGEQPILHPRRRRPAANQAQGPAVPP